MTAPRIYLDNAATSWPKPESVYQAIDDFQRNVGAAAGRGVYRHSADANRIVAQARRGVARLIGAEDEHRICFTANGSDSLNIAIHGVLRPGDHAICTDADHNSVLRPMYFLGQRGVEVTTIGCDRVGLVDPDDIRRAIRPNTRLVAMLHASNVTGTIQPAAEVGAICRQHAVCFLLDAAQSVGHLPLDVGAMKVDMLASPGHKGLLGPLGTGILYVRPGVESLLTPLRQGGTGTNSESPRQPDEMPDRFECGNLNVAGIAGLAAAVDWLEKASAASIHARDVGLAQELDDQFRQLRNIEVFGPRDRQKSVGVVSIAIKGYDPHEVAASLDAAFGIQVRAGLHCAPRIHAAMGTLDRGGTLRLSTGPFTTRDDVVRAIEAIGELASEA